MHASWPPSTPPSLGLAKRKSGLRAPSPLNTLTFHLSTHLLPGHRVSPMLRHRSAGDVGNLSGQPNPHFSCLCVCVCVSACEHVYAPGAFSRNLSVYVASPGGPRQVSVSGCVSSADAGRGALEAGASWSRQSEPSVSLM